MVINSNYYESPTKRKKRNIILNTAFQLFVKKGIQDVSMQEIAQHAGMQRRSLYNYYNDMEQIAIDIMKSHYDNIKLLDWNFEDKTAYESVSSIFTQIYEYIVDNPDFIVFASYFDHLFKEGYKNPDIIEFILSTQNTDPFANLKEKYNIDHSLHPAFAENLGRNLHNLLISMYAFAQKIILNNIKLKSNPSHDFQPIKEYMNLLLNLIKS